MKFSNTTTAVLNLARQPERRRNMRKVCADLGVKNVKFVDAVDGQRLLTNAAGRQRRVAGRTMFNLTWTDPDTNLRVTRAQKLPMSSKGQRGWDVWAFLGCNLSHEKAWRWLQDQGAITALVCEDDCHLNMSPSKARNIINTVLPKMERRFPNWSLCYLGCHPVSHRRPKPNATCGVRGLRSAGCVYQGHAYLIRLEEDVIEFWVKKMHEGLLIDNALVSWTGTTAAQNRAFYLWPPVVGQGRFGSTLCKENNGKGGMSGWAETRKNVTVKKRPEISKWRRKLMGKFGRGARKVSKHVRKASLKATGQAGGVVHAGGSATKAAVATKERWMKKFFADNQRWPTSWEARKKKIGYTLWNRVANRSWQKHPHHLCRNDCGR